MSLANNKNKYNTLNVLYLHKQKLQLPEADSRAHDRNSIYYMISYCCLEN